jgi:hypothetical protein
MFSANRHNKILFFETKIIHQFLVRFIKNIVSKFIFTNEQLTLVMHNVENRYFLLLQSENFLAQ